MVWICPKVQDSCGGFQEMLKSGCNLSDDDKESTYTTLKAGSTDDQKEKVKNLKANG